MKKKVIIGCMAVIMAWNMTGCGGSDDYLLDEDYSKYVTLCEYKGIEATKVLYDVTDEEVLEAIDEDMYEYVTYDVITDRAAEEGDYANVTYTTTVDGEESEDYSGEEEDVVIGEGYIFPEVDEILVGMNSGDSKKIELTITEDYAYNEDDAGKKATIEITLNEINEENFPEYNDDFVKNNTDYNDKEEYETAKKEELLSSKEEEYKYVAVQEILQYLLDNSEFNGYPDTLYQQCEEIYNSDNEYSASMYGMELEEFEELLGLDEDTKKQDIENNVNAELLIGAIARKEDITCSKKEISQFVKDYYADYGYENEEEFLEDYSEEEIGSQIVYEKVADFLYENASLIEISEEEYNAQQEELYDDWDSEDEEVLE